MAWYDRFFAEDIWFDLQRTHYPEGVAQGIAERLCVLLALESGARLLDVPCGTGILAIELARCGMQVSGVDFSRAALDEAREGAERADVALDLHGRDMRDLPFEAEFAAVVNYWGSFGYFDDEGDEAFARAAWRSLEPGGRFLIEVPSAETVYPGWQETSDSEVAGIRIQEERSYDFVTGRVRDEWTFTKEGAAPTTGVTDIRLYSCAELCALLRRVGFGSFAAYADVAGTPFRMGARLKLVATK